MRNRLEFTERYREEVDPSKVEEAENLKLPIPLGEIKYRRIYIRLEDIFAPKEVPGLKKHCHLEFKDGSHITVKGSYDEICILIDDAEQPDEEEKPESEE